MKKFPLRNAKGEVKVKRTMIVATAALLIAGVSAPSFAQGTKHKHMHKKPVATKTVNGTEESKATESKSTVPVAKTPTVTETKPVSAAPSQPSTTETMTNKAMDMAKDKATDVVKDKAMDAATSGMKTPSVPGVK
jgi:hypothetical protein